MRDALRPAGGGTFGGSIDYVSGPTAIPVNAWTHIAVTYDLAALRLYVNGTQVATRVMTGAIQTTTNPLWIGGNPLRRVLPRAHRRGPRLRAGTRPQPRSKPT